MRATLICGLLFSFMSITQVLFAEEAKQESSSENRFGVQGGLLLGLGTMSNNSGNIPSRAMNILALEALPGYRFGNWMPGLYLQYGLVGQSADPATVSNQNLGGAGYLIGIGGTYDWNKF